MRVRFTREALDRLEGIRHFLALESLQIADGVVRAIVGMRSLFRHSLDAAEWSQSISGTTSASSSRIGRTGSSIASVSMKSPCFLSCTGTGCCQETSGRSDIVVVVTGLRARDGLEPELPLAA